MKITTIVGARPQFVKASVVSKALRREGIDETLIHTGQHYDTEMSQVFFDELEIEPPLVNLNVGSASHAVQTAEMMTGIAEHLMTVETDGLLIYGDTNSTLAGVLAATKLHIPVFHVEAGLRSFDRTMPEELNRIVADRLSTLLFCPTREAEKNLATEGITDGVHLVGDVMLESIRLAAAREVDLPDELEAIIRSKFSVATVHRAANVDNIERLESILEALGEAGHPIIFPVHPRTEARVDGAGLTMPGNIKVIPPVGYSLMAKLVAAASSVITDSGGLQKEAYWLATPCITLREETEWSETLVGNWNQLAGWNTSQILAALQMTPTGRPVINDEGQASQKIASALAAWFR